ncbi:hypothetical protein, partial [Ruminococcus sp.]|uniref:hypothetical protein n=1 Tax=Ruminococcus sp. TaxID=41978 RepID=UPI002584BACB
KLLNTENTVIEECEFYTDDKAINHVRIYARPNKWHENDCPYCHKRCLIFYDLNALCIQIQGISAFYPKKMIGAVQIFSKLKGVDLFL